MEQGPFSQHSVDTCSIAKSMSHVSMCDVIHGCCLSDFINTLITSNSGRFGRLKIYVVNLFCQVLVR